LGVPTHIASQARSQRQYKKILNHIEERSATIIIKHRTSEGAKQAIFAPVKG
jgi:hypothetical protein